jgi:excisionase family DNA binding protein
MPELIPTAEAARRLKVDVSTITRWVASGRLTPAFKAPGPRGALAFDPDDVDRLASELTASDRS